MAVDDDLVVGIQLVHPELDFLDRDVHGILEPAETCLPVLAHVEEERSAIPGQARLAGSDRPFLLDVRQDWETRLCRLDNAVHIPIEEIELRADELNADDEIVVYCHQGVRSAAVADYLRQRGFKNVKNLLGGLDYWARTVDPAMRRY